MAEQQRQANAMIAAANTGSASTNIDSKQVMGMSEKKHQKETGGVVVRDGRKYPSKGMKVKGLYDYQTDEDDGLSFKEGQIITIVEADGDWWIGTLSGKQGEFPHNYVEIIESSAPAAAHPSPAPTHPVNTTSHDEPQKKETGGGFFSRLKKSDKGNTTATAPTSAPPGKEKPTGGDQQVVKCQALFDFSAPKDDEDEGEYISFKKGDIIKTTPSSEDWWWGEINGQCGFFPFSYCQLVEGH